MRAESGETICALATPPGTGGIGVIRVSGPDAFVIADRIAKRSRKTSLASLRGRTLHRAELRTAEGGVIDDVLLAVFHAPRSYTGEDTVEISAHGSPLILGQILARLLECGARAARPGEFTLRAFLNGKMDLAQAEAVADLIAAQTDEAKKLARRQGAGHLSRAVGDIRGSVLGALARIEASIDFPEDVGELDSEACSLEIATAQAQIVKLLATADRGILARAGLNVVLAGRPNVGKSSLLNALLRTDRAIVTAVPGTTRDVIEETLNLQGIALRLSDTAGLRETDDAVEKIGVERTRQSLADADLVLLVLDAADGETPEDAALRGSLTDCPSLIVWNKWDLRPGSETPPYGVAISAATGWNLAALEDAIAQSILSGAASAAEDMLVTHARHKQALEAAQTHLEEASATLAAGLPSDFASIDLRSALHSLGLITGETATEEIIHEIFSRFCIGK